MVFAYFCVIFKGVIYGLTVFFTSRLTETTDVLDILALRFLLSFAVMWVLKQIKVIKVDIGAKDFIKKNPRTPFIKSIILAGLFEPVLYMLFETLGISMTTGITAAVILSLSPIFSLIVERFLLREKATLLQIFFLGCGIFGAIYISLNTVSDGGNDSFLGILFVLLAVISGALFCGFSRKAAPHFSAMEITYVSCALGAIIFNLVNVVRHIAKGDILSYFNPYFSLENMIGFLFLGVLSTIVATGMNNHALSKLQVSTTAAFGGVSTIVTIAVGIIFNNESLAYYHYIGLPFIFARMIGVSAISIINEKRKNKAETTKKE
ncbi:MAG: DMT family transporter [Ruminococcaceae bacterium]|nr:DMT family transporter [Oscillospiraceae bacterium]